MTIFQKISAVWKEDGLLRRVVKNSSYLFGSNIVSSGLSFIQTIIAVRLIGVTNWGLVGVVQTFASNINRFLSFRMSEVVVKHLPASLAEDKKQEAAALVKATGLTEALTSVVTFVALVLLAPWAARFFASDATTAPLFVFYGLIILSNLINETSIGVLQATRRFDALARFNLIQSVITLSVIGGTYVLFRWSSLVSASDRLTGVLLAYVLGKTFCNVAQVIVAVRELNRTVGKDWWKASLRQLPGKRSLVTFALNTSLNGTVNLFARDNLQLYVASLLSVTAAGYFKIAMTFTTPLMLILDPFIAPTYAEISRTIAKFQWKTTLQLLRRITIIASGIVLAIWSGWVLIGWWLIPVLYKPQASPAYPLVLILVAGYGFASIFQWNRSLFLSLGKPGYPVLVATLITVIELTLMFVFVPRYGPLMMAAVLSGYFIVSNGILALRGWWEVHRRQVASPA